VPKEASRKAAETGGRGPGGPDAAGLTPRLPRRNGPAGRSSGYGLVPPPAGSR
jgi:hypothetical protein